MDRQSVDIFISGGGVAGLTAAAAFGAAGFTVLCADPTPPVTEGSDPDADLRTTAFLQPARTLLEEAGIWPRLAADATPLQVMRIVDASGVEGSVIAQRDFDASDVGDAPFGWNLRNWMLRREILARLDELPNVTFRSGVGFRAMVARDSHAIVTLTDRTQVETALVIGADGRDSPVRHAAGIAARTKRYGQKALTFAVTHANPHDNVSTEIHREGGPFTLVPLPDHNGSPCSAVVWMVDGAEAHRLRDLNDAEFSAEATVRSADLYGDLTLATRRQVWPIITRTATRLDGPRTALMAEAAHVMPPIGAQGLNTSLADLRSLLDLAITHRNTLGSREMLSAYNRARHSDIALRSRGISLLNQTSQIGNPMLQKMRAEGVKLIHDIKPLRTTLMRMGLGQR